MRTPDKRFAELPGFDFEPNYFVIKDAGLGDLRIHYLDEGPRDGRVVLCMHGNPSWCYLYRKMIPVFARAGHRVLAPDLIGFGRSDKPADPAVYTYRKHIAWMRAWLDGMGIGDITLVAQDWGGLIGLRLLTDMPDRFAAVSLSNTGLPTGDQPMSEAFLKWQAWSAGQNEYDPGLIVNEFGRGSLSEAEMNAYRAPFPDQNSLAHVKVFPLLVPSTPQDPEHEANLRAWQQLTRWDKPLLLCFADGDPVTAGGEKAFMKLVPGAQGQPHRTLHGTHFIQETQGKAWARAIVDWMQDQGRSGK